MRKSKAAISRGNPGSLHRAGRGACRGAPPAALAPDHPPRVTAQARRARRSTCLPPVPHSGRDPALTSSSPCRPSWSRRRWESGTRRPGAGGVCPEALAVSQRLGAGQVPGASRSRAPRAARCLSAPPARCGAGGWRQVTGRQCTGRRGGAGEEAVRCWLPGRFSRLCGGGAGRPALRGPYSLRTLPRIVGPQGAGGSGLRAGRSAPDCAARAAARPL